MSTDRIFADIEKKARLVEEDEYGDKTIKHKSYRLFIRMNSGAVYKAAHLASKDLWPSGSVVIMDERGEPNIYINLQFVEGVSIQWL